MFAAHELLLMPPGQPTFSPLCFRRLKLACCQFSFEMILHNFSTPEKAFFSVLPHTFAIFAFTAQDTVSTQKQNHQLLFLAARLVRAKLRVSSAPGTDRSSPIVLKPHNRCSGKENKGLSGPGFARARLWPRFDRV